MLVLIALLAQAGFEVWAEKAVIVIAFCMIVVIAAKAMGAKIPDWLIHMGVVLIVAVVAIAGLRFLSGL